MNKFFLLVFTVLFGFFTVNAEEVEINLTQGYALDIWWHPVNGVIKSEPRDNWDIAFQTGQKGAIWINSQKGMKLWVVPASDHETFLTYIDTTGMSSSWETFNNSVETWDIGAFNCDKDGFVTGGDFGWGAYNMATHNILGDKVFVIKLADNSYRQIFIESLASGTYTVKWADLKGDNETTLVVAKGDYATKNFVYATMADQKIIDREPAKDTWALLFGKYTGMVMTQAGTKAPYSVTGVRSNAGYYCAKLTDVDPIAVKAPELTAENYSTSITTLGDDWKKLNADFTYSIPNRVAYFITNEAIGTADAKVDKIVFKSFAGSATGKMTFLLNPTAGNVDYSFNNNDINVYPEVISKNSVLNFEYNFENIPNFVNVKIIDMSGREAISQKFENISAKGNLSMNIPAIANGVYFAIVETNNALYSYKIIVE